MNFGSDKFRLITKSKNMIPTDASKILVRSANQDSNLNIITMNSNLKTRNINSNFTPLNPTTKPSGTNRCRFQCWAAGGCAV